MLIGQNNSPSYWPTLLALIGGNNEPCDWSLKHSLSNSTNYTTARASTGLPKISVGVYVSNIWTIFAMLYSYIGHYIVGLPIVALIFLYYWHEFNFYAAYLCPGVTKDCTCRSPFLLRREALFCKKWIFSFAVEKNSPWKRDILELCKGLSLTDSSVDSTLGIPSV